MFPLRVMSLTRKNARVRFELLIKRTQRVKMRLWRFIYEDNTK